MTEEAEGLAAELRRRLQTASATNLHDAPREADRRPSRSVPSAPVQPGTAALDAADRLLRAAGHRFPAIGRWTVVGPEGEVEVVTEREVWIGRTPRPRGSSLVVTDDRVSRRHARVVLDGDGATVADLGSTNGTWIRRGPSLLPVDVNGEALAPGDQIVTVEDLVLATVRHAGEPS